MNYEDLKKHISKIHPTKEGVYAIMTAVDKHIASLTAAKPPTCGGNCGINYCDEYGCIEAKPQGVELSPPPQYGA